VGVTFGEVARICSSSVVPERGGLRMKKRFSPPDSF
jgi:hypothetical protein